MLWAVRAALLAGAAILLAGCVPLALIGYEVALATTPDPVTSIEVISAHEPNACKQLIDGDTQHASLKGIFERYYSQASTKSPSETSVPDWKRGGADHSFVVLASTKETPSLPATYGDHVRQDDAARSFLDLNSDGQPDLVYEVYGPPNLTLAYVALPADDKARRWFENQLGGLPQDWRADVEAHGGNVVEPSKGDQDRLARIDRGSVIALPTFALLRVEEASYAIVWERDIKFDPTRSLPPLTLGSKRADERATTAAAIASVYRIRPDFGLEPQCEILGQWMGIRLGGL